jgi:MFS family permease
MCVRIILADRVSLAEYAFNFTLFSLASAVAFSIGPVIGGFLTESNWRWCFGINLPVAAVAIVVVVLILRKELIGPQPLPHIEGREKQASTRYGRFIIRMSTLDYGGQLLFLWGFGLIILGLTWAGGTYGWGTAKVLAPLVIGVVLSVVWFGYEYLMTPGKLMARILPFQRAMIPWELLSQRDIGLLFFVNFGSGMAMFAILYFMDLYFALVLGNSASKAGVSLLYFLPGLGGMYNSQRCEFSREISNSS